MTVFKKLGNVRYWWRDGLFNRICGNAGLMFAGGICGQGLSFVALMLIARALGPDRMGVFALIQAYVMTVGLILSFQSWQGMIRFGARALENDDRKAFRSLLKFGLLLDGGAAVFSTVVSMGGVFIIGRWQGWSTEIIQTTALFSLLILFRVVGLPQSVFRLHNRFRIVAGLQLSVALMRVVTVGVAFFLTGRIWVFLLLWGGSEAINNMIAMILAWRLLIKEGHGGFLASPLKDLTREHPGILRFFLTTKVTSSLQLGVKEFDIFLVAAILGTGATGVYKVVREIARIPAVLVGPIQQAIYPELARLWASGLAAQFVRMNKRLSAIGGAIGFTVWLAITLGAPWILRLLAGDEYADARWVLTFYMLSVALFCLGVSLRPAMLSIGKPGKELASYAISSALYFVSLPLLTYVFGLLGVGLAQVVFQGSWLNCMLLGLRGPVRRALADEASAAGPDPSPDAPAGVASTST